MKEFTGGNTDMLNLFAKIVHFIPQRLRLIQTYQALKGLSRSLVRAVGIIMTRGCDKPIHHVFSKTHDFLAVNTCVNIPSDEGQLKDRQKNYQWAEFSHLRCSGSIWKRTHHESRTNAAM